jgi:hypothetical protein
MQNIRTWIFGPSVPTFRFTRWCEIQAQIEKETNPEILSQLLYSQECRAGRYEHEIEGLESLYVDPATPPPYKKISKRQKQIRDTSAFD